MDVRPPEGQSGARHGPEQMSFKKLWFGSTMTGVVIYGISQNDRITIVPFAPVPTAYVPAVSPTGERETRPPDAVSSLERPRRGRDAHRRHRPVSDDERREDWSGSMYIFFSICTKDIFSNCFGNGETRREHSTKNGGCRVGMSSANSLIKLTHERSAGRSAERRDFSASRVHSFIYKYREVIDRQPTPLDGAARRLDVRSRGRLRGRPEVAGGHAEWTP